ncbi:heme utilization protein [Magnetospirillum sp. UT-4]|uniref:heme utilization protein n=1 Tax=Magnetospirillum sp. UT-4 TaxID=2681467 RepID=UPI00137DC9D0|nr:heme utilization protein [Magnetospirillum sp. UT-4]CAA7612738.1 conserved exported hypothetical protein [Magnetospirillum sp. UT-4]
MRRVPATAAMAFLALAAAAPVAAQARCANPPEVRALQVRQLHIQLQVASLNCRVDDPSLPGKYAAYVNRFGGALSDNAKVLKAHYARSGTNMDRAMTSMANDESQRAHLVENYCEQHVPLFERLSALKPGELEHFASTTMDQPETPACRAPAIRQASAATAAAAPAAKPKAKPAAKKADAKG